MFEPVGRFWVAVFFKKIIYLTPIVRLAKNLELVVVRGWKVCLH
jgi:hypothetical protein